MQNQPWSWGQPGTATFPTAPVFPSGFPPPTVDQNQLMPSYQQIYGAPPPQAPPNYATSQWSAAQLQHWQQWQQWQEKYQQWQAQYGKKYAESIAAMGQTPTIIVPSVPPPLTKPNEIVTNPGYTTVNPPPPPSNAQPVPPPPPEEDKPTGGSGNDKDARSNEFEAGKDGVEELSEAEKMFDIQFKQWEDQFNEWKKQNQDHPDKVQYREYEKKWETWREQLLQRREQMRKKRLNKVSEKTNEANVTGKPEESKEETQAKAECGNSYKTDDNQNQANLDPKLAAPHTQEGQGFFQQHKPPDGTGNFGPTPNMEGNIADNRGPGYFDRENPNLKPGPGPAAFGFGGFDNSNKFRNVGMDNREKDFPGGGQRFDNSNRGDFPMRRPFGNGNFEDERNDRNFGPRFGNFDNRKPPGQDRFPDRMNDGKFNNMGRDFGPGMQNEQCFNQGGRNFQDRNIPGEIKPPFMQNQTKNNVTNSFSKPKVPSLFDITVEKPPGLRSPGMDRKPKIWEQEKFDGPEKEEMNPQRNETPWLSNVAWATNNSPWIKPWELGRVMSEKPPDANLRPDAWRREPLRTDDKPWAAETMDKSELSGYVGKLLAKLGNINNMLPNKEVFMGDNSGKFDEKLESNLPLLMQGQNWPIRNERNAPNMFNQDQGNHPGNFSRDRFDDSNFGPQSNPKDSRNDDVMGFGRGDREDRMRFDRGRDNRRDDRNFAGGEPFRRDDRGPFADEGRNLANRNLPEDDRFFGKGDRNSFGRDDNRPGAKVSSDDLDDRNLRNRDRNGRRGFDDRDDRGFRGICDRDDRRGRNFGSPFDKYGRNDQSAKDLEWNPQVFDYSKSSQSNFRSRFSDPDDNFHISTVVDYSHGENKQTFDYGHGEAKNDNLPIKAFDYGHGRESPAVIDYGHGNDRDLLGQQMWKKDGQDKINDKNRSRSKSKSPQRRSRSPRGRGRSRSRSPYSGYKNKRDSNSPPFRGRRSRSRDRFNRPNVKRNRRNNSEEKTVQGSDGDVSKTNFDITTVLVEDLICSPGRESRPNKLVFIMRGLPGSGKTYVTKLIKDKEVELGGDAPRILSLDDYFMTEVEKDVVDEETGRKMKKKVLEYEYESCVEPHYRGSLLKAFKKTVSDGFFSFIIVDSVNEKTKDYEEMWSFAKSKGFQVYVAEMDDDVAVCTKRNIHKRTEKEISDLAKAWEKTPIHYLRLDVRSLLQADAITEVEMEVVSDTDLDKTIDRDKENQRADEEDKEDDDEDEPGESTFVKSRWDHFENSEQKLDRLDGLKRRREGFHTTMEDYLQLPDDFDLGSSEATDGKKRVRWADLEERRQQEKMRAIGFVVGQTDWSRMTDPTFGESALTRTKYI